MKSSSPKDFHVARHPNVAAEEPNDGAEDEVGTEGHSHAEHFFLFCEDEDSEEGADEGRDDEDKNGSGPTEE